MYKFSSGINNRERLVNGMQMLPSQHSINVEEFRGKRIRFLLYSHDTFGLGHIRRALSLAEYFTSALPDAQVLIVTGSPFAHS